jgi:HK97 family phage major capsid protein
MTVKQYGQLIAEKRSAVDALYAKYLDEAGQVREDAAIDPADLAAIESLETEIREAETAKAGAEAFEKRAAENAAAMRAATTVATTLPHPAQSVTTSRSMEFGEWSVPSTQRRGGHLRAFTASAERGTTQRQAEALGYGMGQWFRACLGNPAARQWCEENGVEVRTLGESANGLGGFLVPHQFDSTIIDLREEYGVFRKHTNIVQMSSDTASRPRRTGGVTAYWVGESDTITQSDKNWDRVSLVAKKLGAIAKMSNELSEDAIINVGDDLAFEIGYAFAVAEDNAGFIGDGSSTYGGVTGAARKLRDVDSTRANIAGLVVASGALSTVTLANLNTVKSRLPLYAQKRAAWFVHSAVYADLFERLALDAGGATAESIINGVGTPRFLGYPVVLTQSMPSVTATDTVVALLGDLSMGSMLGDRRQTTVTFSTDALNTFEKDEIAVRGTERIDIVVHDVGNSSATAASRVAGPIVGIATAA